MVSQVNNTLKDITARETQIKQQAAAMRQLADLLDPPPAPVDPTA